MSTFVSAESVGPLVMRLVEKNYPDLGEVTYNLLFAHGPRDESGFAKGPALKLHGYPCCAIIKINSLEQRVAGLADVTIKIDGDEWPTWDDKKRLAILDHELFHLVPLIKGQSILMDDAGRPKLKLRNHDWQLGGFAEIVRRHGDNAVEAVAFRATADRHGQLLMPWGEEKPAKNGVKVKVGDTEFDLANPVHKQALQAGLDAVAAGKGRKAAALS